MLKKTREEKEMQGTYEPSKEAADAVEYELYERIPIAPRDWPPVAQKIWEDRCRDLKAAGYLAKAMIPGLRRYCFAVYMAEVAERMILENDFGEHGFIKQRAWLGVLESSNKAILQFGSKFGFTPLDVQKIPMVKKEADKTMSLLK
jgi:phage terminase small subunit